MMKTIEVVAAIILDGDKIFATQRGYGDFKDSWEFPGGKLEDGETREEALLREIREELDTEIGIKEHLITVDYDYPNFHLTLHCYICEVIHGELKLLEHEACRWLNRNELDSLSWLPADISVLEKLREYLDKTQNHRNQSKIIKTNVIH